MIDCRSDRAYDGSRLLVLIRRNHADSTRLYEPTVRALGPSGQVTSREEYRRSKEEDRLWSVAAGEFHGERPLASRERLL